MMFKKTKKLTATVLTAISLLGGTVMASPASESKQATSVEQPVSISVADEFLEALGTAKKEAFGELYQQAMGTQKFLDAMGESDVKKFVKFHDLLVSGNTKEAVGVVRNLINGHDGWMKELLRVFRGLAYLFYDDCDKLIADSTKDIKDDAKDHVAYMTRIRGYVLRLKRDGGDYSSENMTLALNDLEKYIELADEDEVDLYRMINAFFRMNRQEYSRALELLNLLVERNPQDADYLVLRAECYLKMDKDAGVYRGYNEENGIKVEDWRLPDGKEKALSDLDKAILLSDSFSKRLSRSNIRSELNDFEGAWRDLETAEKLATSQRDHLKLYYQSIFIGMREEAITGSKRDISVNAEPAVE